MESSPAAQRALQALANGTRARPADATVFEDALVLAGAPEIDAATSLDLDRTVLTALRDEPNLDSVLERIDLRAIEGLAGRASARLAEAPAGEPPHELRVTAWEVLDLLRRSALLRRIADAGEVEAWAERILGLVDRSHLTTGVLFRRHAEAYGSRTLFELGIASGGRTLSWRHTSARADAIARGLLSLPGGGGGPRVAILSENRPEMAVCDLACLGAGIVNVMIPANATEDSVRFMLLHARASIAIAGDHEQLGKILAVGDALPDLRHVVVMEPRAASRGVLTLDEVSAGAGAVPPAEIERRALAARIDDLATIMYTSGTTGHPKGICFSHRNLVFKRFARALALPAIGEADVFLCYLPLYHTFGRFLEMLGCVFWGATYCFLDNPSVEALVQGMRRYRPTAFISVPKKWIQLHEAITVEAPPDRLSDAEVLDATRRLTGGRLRWGLSAAGHLPSEIFRFFQVQGIELMSGFGMTEATGGITMTPPGGYRDDSLGLPLPGIEVRIGDDGEMAVRGPYVMIGYLDPHPGETDLDAEGWFRTGDLMARDADGHVRLVDRKKEIYKNIKGETIAPQRIESLFREFDSVGRVFLVGDHREYNTVLIWPNPEATHVDLTTMTPEEKASHFRSIVVSINAFLAPFERLVDFEIIDRDLDPAQGELTPKGTPRRKVVEAHFAETIRLLYRRAQLKIGGVDLIVPNWLFQALGLTARDLEIDGDRLGLPTGSVLRVRRLQDGVAQIGSCVYGYPAGPIQLGVLLTTPRLWLGNEELVAFAPLDVKLRERPGRAGDGIDWRGRLASYVPDPSDPDPLASASSRADLDLMDLHGAALLLSSTDDVRAGAAVRLLDRVLAQAEGPLAEPARLLLGRAASSPSIQTRRRAFQTLTQSERDSRFPATLRRFLDSPGVVLDAETRAVLCEMSLSDAKIGAFLAEAQDAARAETAPRGLDRRLGALLRWVAAYGAAHPVQYRRLRAFLVRQMATSGRESARLEASRALEELQKGFRAWLGPTVRVGVDPETGQEYRWDDVITVEDGIPADDERRIVAAIRQTAFLREAVFLFSRGATPRLSDIPPGGVWIRPLGERGGKAVYRITVQTRFHESYDLAVNVNRSLTPEQVREEITSLLLCAGSGNRDPLVEEFGGYWPEQDLWSEEFVAGESLDRSLRRLARQNDDERFRQMWIYFAWNVLAAFFEFWNRTGRRIEIADPSLANVIVPTHDFQTGARIVSVSAMRPHAGLAATLRFFREELVRPVEAQYPALADEVGWTVLASALLESVGEAEGLRMLRELVHRESGSLPDDLSEALRAYLPSIEQNGFLPMRLYLAIRRYRRWERLNVDPTPGARAGMLGELWETYGLARLTGDHPEARVRFFRNTVFRDASPALADGLEELIGLLRRREIVGDALIDAITDLRGRIELGADEDYFLARLSLPHLKPEDSAGFVLATPGGRHHSEIVVTLEDADGAPFHVRHALTPKEVGRLHQLFLGANLDVRFRPEHLYLVAVGERQQIIGGIFYETDVEGRSAHLEKIVVAERYRKKGVADGLMREFFNRLKAQGMRTVTTGFFRPQYFYGYGFTIEKRYAGLVKTLEA